MVRSDMTDPEEEAVTARKRGGRASAIHVGGIHFFRFLSFGVVVPARIVLAVCPNGVLLQWRRCMPWANVVVTAPP